MRIPLFVSASGILVVLAAGFAVTLALLSHRYQRQYLHEWQVAWIALGVYALTAGLALLAVNLPVLAASRSLFSLISIGAAWWHLRALGRGMRDLCEPLRPIPAWRERALGLLVLVAAALTLVPVAPRSDASLRLYLWRIALLAAAWAIGYATAGWAILRQRTDASKLARGTLGYSLLAYALLRALEPLTHFLGPSPILAQFLTFGGLPILVAMATGMLITLLEVERERAVREAEARAYAERNATDSEALLATALASSTDPVLIVDPTGGLLAFNTRFATLVRDVRGIRAEPGMRVEALMGANTQEFWRDAFSRALCGEAQMRTQPFFLTPGEAPRTFAVRVTPVRRGDETLGVLIVAHDATQEERLRSALARREEWFRSMIENASDIIFQVAPDGTLDYASPSLQRLLGRDPVRVVGTDAFAYVHADDAATLRDAMQRSFAGDDSVPTTVPFRALHADGAYVHLEAVSRPFVEGDGTPRLIVVARDVRERRRLESELLSARRLESVGRLAGGVAHDFNNLLTAVVGNLTLMREQVPSTSPLSEHLDEIDHAVQRGAELTRRLLAFARRQMIEPRLLDLGVQLHDLERLLKRLIGERIALHIVLTDGLWATRADPTAVEQVLVNLAVNARDAMPDGGSLRIAARNVTVTDGGLEGLAIPAGDWLRVDVRDTGVGIDEAVLGQIFEPFFTTKDRSGGTGLGLATVYGAMTQSGGHVRVSSTVGRGTTFSLFFPRADVLASPAPSGAPSGMPRAKPGETVLLMEDETSVREVTSKLLKRLGYTVLTAEDGQEGLNVARAHTGPLHLIVSDLVMPGLGGAEAVATIRQSRPETRVIFISGFSEQALGWKDGAPSNGRLLSKPFSVDDLATAVRTALDN